ncbi:hypothetical protein BZG36_03711 [Bifiguratus adelaidae]|uniref:P-type ATPase A domain-containing protein n=1 Tax=Bifiguratus adelaidae TaxID=1938954 RepID=A0A261XXT7_9FUNG|nr:hypothetical protein BZG36_03711 [Bifiguratus adelaidae]
MKIPLTVARGCTWLLIGVGIIDALPVFEPINAYDKNGNVCPLKNATNVACPILCVSSVDRCPGPVSTSACGAGKSLCLDGSCAETCDPSIANACWCGGSSSSQQLVPCYLGQLVNLTAFDTQNRNPQLFAACAAGLGLSNAAVGAWNGTSETGQQEAQYWLDCPAPPTPMFTWREPMWVAVWTLMSLEAFILLSWWAYKRLRERAFHRGIRNEQAPDSMPAERTSKAGDFGANDPVDEKSAAVVEDHDSTDSSSSGITSEKQDVKQSAEVQETLTNSKVLTGPPLDTDGSTLNEADRVQFRGYNNDWFGYIGFASVLLTTLGFLVFLGVIVGDYYGSVDGVAFGVFLTSDLSSKIFCAVWHISTVWLICVNFSRSRLRNWFRIETYAHEAAYVQVEKPQESVIFLDDGSKLLMFLKRWEVKVRHAFKADILVNTCRVHFTGQNRRYFEYQCARYVYNPTISRFEPFAFELGDSHAELLTLREGLSLKQAVYRIELLGPNFVGVNVPSIPIAILQEFTNWFYIYQMMCLWVWYYFQYYQMGLVQTCVILVSAFIKIFLRLRAEHRIKAMAEYETEVMTLRDGEWKSYSSSELVPGDVFEIAEAGVMPCDAVLLSGNVVVDESSLTGEALPVRKFPIHDDDGVYESTGSGKVNTLFAGTTVSQAVPVSANPLDLQVEGSNEPVDSHQNRVTAIVVATGINSEKGQLIHKILFPTPISFIFNEHLKLVVIILLLWGFVAYCLTIYLMGRGDITSWFYGIFVISEIFSPLLPAALTVGQSVAATRLRNKNIYCIDLPRIIVAGKVRIFCFDKTGTLTREGLEFFGAVGLDHVETPIEAVDDETSKTALVSKRTFAQHVEDPGDIDPLLRMGIATCHAVTKVKDQFVGNPVDIESFQAVQWRLESPREVAHIDTLVPPRYSAKDDAGEPQPVHILKRFEFVHARASQSVAVHDTRTNKVHVYVKGSFERIKHIVYPSSLPADYDAVASQFAQQGCYVLSMAHRELGLLGETIQMEQIKALTRDELEAGCEFLGLVMFRNKLKEDTPDAIRELKEGDTRTVMITGDNALTGIFIARQCGMIADHQMVLLGDATSGTRGPVTWTNVDTGEQVDVAAALKDKKFTPVELAVTGRAFEALVEQGEIRNLLLDTRIFARMTPNDKVKCVQLHMEKSITAMCGDGGNDCGALRAAHVGIALSEAEASIVSPFSTNKRTVMQCVELLKQGRAALATSFAGYQFLILYGETMAWFELLMFYFTVIASQPIWIMIDGFFTPILTFCLTQAQPAKKLSARRPTARLLGPYTLISTIGVIFINFWFIVGAIIWLFQQPWFLCNEFDSTAVDAAQWWLLGDNYEAEIIALASIFPFFHSSAVFNFGNGFRRSWWRNYVLVAAYLICFTSSSWLVLADPNPYSCIFRVNCGSVSVLESLGYQNIWWPIEDYNSPLGHNVLPRDFRYKFWAYLVCQCILTVVWQRIVVLWLGRKWVIRHWGAKREAKRTQLKL